MDCNWLMIRSSHCPILVRIESNDDFLSCFESVVIGITKIRCVGQEGVLAMYAHFILTLNQLTHPRVLMGTVVLYDS